MGSLGSGLYIWLLLIFLHHALNCTQGEQNGLCAQQREPSSSNLRAFPISPEDWFSRCRLIRDWFSRYRLMRCELIGCRSSRSQWPENSTHPSRVDAGVVFLTLRT